MTSPHTTDSVLTFRSSVPARLFSFVSGVLIGIAVSIGITKLLVDDRLGITDQTTLVTICLLLMALFSAVVVARVFFVSPVRIVVSGGSVEFWQGRRKRHTWLRNATQFSSFVTRTTTNGVRTSSVRRLVATTSTERLELACTWFSPKTFNALIAELVPLVGAQVTRPIAPPTGLSEAVPAATGIAGTGRVTVNHSFLRRGRMTIAIIALVAGIATVVLLSTSGTPALWAVGCGGAVMVVLLVLLVPLSVQNRAMPHEIEVSPSSLQIDDELYPMGDLVSIVATPANYSGVHNLVVRDHAGRVRKFRFGAATSKTFPEYGRFLHILAAATAHRPGLFTLNVA
jgi:hypothetical protein